MSDAAISDLEDQVYQRWQGIENHTPCQLCCYQFLLDWYSDMDRAKVVVHITNIVLNRVPISNDQPIFNHRYGIGKATEHASLVGPMSSSSTVLHIQ
jgi:hypothetical protein